MTAFEYVLVLISIILGLGITTILTGVAELVKQTRLPGLYAPYIMWIALVFLIYIQEWWVAYELKSVQAWTLHKFLVILIYPITLYILAHLLFPTGVSREFTSKEFYLNHYPRLFIGVIILDIQSIIYNLAFSGLALQTQIPHLAVLIILSTMITTKTKNSVIHTIVAVLLLLLLLVSLAVERRVIY
jgi:hypothetical protein